MADTDNPNTIPALVAAATGIAALDVVEALDRVEDAITRCETTLLSLGISQAQATEEGLSLLREAFWKFAERVENTEIEKGDPATLRALPYSEKIQCLAARRAICGPATIEHFC